MPPEPVATPLGPAAARPPPWALVLDDAALQNLLLENLLARLGLGMRAAADTARAQAELCRGEPAVMLVELLPGGGRLNGFEAGAALMRRCGAPCILMSASGRATDRAWARKLGFHAALERPCGLSELRETLGAAGWKP